MSQLKQVSLKPRFKIKKTINEELSSRPTVLGSEFQTAGNESLVLRSPFSWKVVPAMER